MELPFFSFLDGLPEELEVGPVTLAPRETASAAVRGLVSAAINAKVDFDAHCCVKINTAQTAASTRPVF